MRYWLIVAGPVNTIDALTNSKTEAFKNLQFRYSTPEDLIEHWPEVRTASIADLETVIIKLKCVDNLLARPKGWTKRTFQEKINKEFTAYCVIGALRHCIEEDTSPMASTIEYTQKNIGTGLLNACVPISTMRFNSNGFIISQLNAIEFNDNIHTRKIMVRNMVKRAIALAERLINERRNNSTTTANV